MAKWTDEAGTPTSIIDAARVALGGTIELDPASSRHWQQWVQAEQFYSIADDGLIQRWDSNSIWLNPPYSQPGCRLFCEKLIEWWHSKQYCAKALCVINISSGIHFHSLLKASDSVLILTRRLNFRGWPDANRHQQAIFEFGCRIDAEGTRLIYDR